MSNSHLPARQPNLHWLAYALPMLAVWLLYLLAFWPAVLSYDSIVQWGEAAAGQFSNWHPAFHTMLLWLVVQVVPSPAAVAVLQMLSTALVAAWGLGLLRRAGAPVYVPWLLASLFALLPVTGLMVVTLWKDVAYGSALLLLTLLVFRLVMWPETLLRPWGWISLGLTAAGVALLRHNGIPVALGVLVLLLVLVRRSQKPLALALVVGTAVTLFVQGPLFAWAGVDRTPLASLQVPMHYLAAHLASSTPLQPEEAALLERVRPIADDWEYDCSLVNSTINDKVDFNFLLANQRAVLHTLADLSLRRPKAFLHHVYCSSKLVWNVLPPPPGYYYIHPLKWDGSRLVTIAENKLGLRANSQLPGVQAWLANLAIDSFDTLLWRPAVYLYLALLCGGVAAWRTRRSNLLLVLAPLVIQSGVLLFVMIANDFRYGYPAVLIALFSLGLPFLPPPALSGNTSTKH